MVRHGVDSNELVPLVLDDAGDVFLETFFQGRRY